MKLFAFIAAMVFTATATAGVSVILGYGQDYSGNRWAGSPYSVALQDDAEDWYARLAYTGRQMWYDRSIGDYGGVDIHTLSGGVRRGFPVNDLDANLFAGVGYNFLDYGKGGDWDWSVESGGEVGYGPVYIGLMWRKTWTEKLDDLDVIFGTVRIKFP